MLRLHTDEPLAISLAGAIRSGDLASLERLLREHQGLATARICKGQEGRAPLHVATDWPGHFPNVGAAIAALVEAGADPNARCEGVSHTETPLHWAASSDDVEALDALIDAGADIEATGGSIGGGTPLDDAVGYGQWQVAKRLVACGARMKLWHAAALGLLLEVESRFSIAPLPSAAEVNGAFYQACQGGQRETAEYLLGKGADINWIPDWAKGRTALDIARAQGGATQAGARAKELAAWLTTRGAKPGAEPA